jgi:hypothetical protein
VDRVGSADPRLLSAATEATLAQDYGVAPESVAVLRALADVIAPALGDCPAASEVQAHLRAAQSLEMLQRGSTTLLTRLLDMYAKAERRDARFLDLDTEARGRVLHTLAEEDLDEMRDVVEGAHAFVLGGYLAGHPAGAGLHPKVWDAMGFNGPASQHLDLLAGTRTATDARTHE